MRRCISLEFLFLLVSRSSLIVPMWCMRFLVESNYPAHSICLSHRRENLSLEPQMDGSSHELSSFVLNLLCSILNHRTLFTDPVSTAGLNSFSIGLEKFQSQMLWTMWIHRSNSNHCLIRSVEGTTNCQTEWINFKSLCNPLQAIIEWFSSIGRIGGFEVAYWNRSEFPALDPAIDRDEAEASWRSFPLGIWKGKFAFSTVINVLHMRNSVDNDRAMESVAISVFVKPC
jgi:hypothetical protein